MTQEEKAKAYDESIKKAMELWNSPRTCFDIEQLKSIFPELKDSEDERIRKSLIDFFGEQCDMSDVNGVYAYEVVAWLEKQKEQKPVDEEELSKFCEANFNAGKRVVLNNPEEYGLQKPAEWSEEDDVMFKTAKKIIWESEASDGTTNKVISWLEGRFKSLRPPFKPSKEQEEPEYYQHFDPDC